MSAWTETITGWLEDNSGTGSKVQSILQERPMKEPNHLIRRPYSSVFEHCPGCDECNKPSSRIFLLRDPALRLLRKLLGLKPQEQP